MVHGEKGSVAGFAESLATVAELIIRAQAVATPRFAVAANNCFRRHTAAIRQLTANSWDANTWVYEYNVHKRNIDKLKEKTA